MGERFQNRFQSPELVGEGGSGSVFRVLDPRLERDVALKVLHDTDDKERYIERFEREAVTTGRLEHPSIPPVYEYGKDVDGLPYFVLKYLEGEDLSRVIARLRDGDKKTHEAFPFSRRVLVCIRLCEAVNYAHAAGVLHRDIKPENIMLGPFGEVWLVDWGLAVNNPESEGQTVPEGEITQENTFLGTLSYAAPEQVTGDFSPASDQYSLGTVFYEFFSLQKAHSGETVQELLESAVSKVPRVAESVRNREQGRVPREISVVIKRMLEKKKKDRFPSIDVVLREFEIIAGGDIRPICPHTLTKKGLHRFGRFLDNHNYWFMPLALIWLLYPLYALVEFLSAQFWP